MSSENYQFIIDANLGKLAKHLRFYGISVLFEKDKCHLELETDALIRELPLVTTSKTHRIPDLCITIPGTFKASVSDQIEFLCMKLSLHRLFDLANTRCGLCNTRLLICEPKQLENILPSKVLQYYECMPSNQNQGKNFSVWMCCTCQKFYWSGTHWNNIVKKIANYIQNI